MPEWKIWYERIEYDELDPLAWGHMFHGQWLEPYIRLKIENKNTVNSIGNNITIWNSSIIFLWYYKIRNN